MSADLSPAEAAQFLQTAQALSQELISGFERIGQMEVQLRELLQAPTQSQLRGADQITTGERYWFVPANAGVPIAQIEAQLQNPAVIPADLSRVACTIFATPLFAVAADGDLTLAAPMRLKEAPFLTAGPGVSTSPGDLFIADGVSIAGDGIGAAVAVNEVAALMTVTEVRTRAELFLRPAPIAIPNTSAVGYLARVGWISFRQIPQPRDGNALARDIRRPCRDC